MIGTRDGRDRPTDDNCPVMDGVICKWKYKTTIKKVNVKKSISFQPSPKDVVSSHPSNGQQCLAFKWNMCSPVEHVVSVNHFGPAVIGSQDKTQ